MAAAQSLGFLSPSQKSFNNLNFKNNEAVHLWVIRRGNTIEVSRDLSPQIRDHDKLLQDVLGQDVGVASLLDVVRGDIDMIRPQVQVGRRDCSHSPFGLAGKSVPLVVACGGGDGDCASWCLW